MERKSILLITAALGVFIFAGFATGAELNMVKDIG